jgi:AraC family transcriptional regulator
VSGAFVAAVFSRKQATPGNAIATLYRSTFGKVEFLRCNGLHASARRREFATHLHFTLPLAGSFVWHADHDSVFADPTTLLCTQQGESFRMSHPNGGDASLVLTPTEQVLSHLSEPAQAAGLETPRRIFVAPARAQLLAYRFYADPTTKLDTLAADECLVQFFESIALDRSMGAASAAGCTTGLVRRSRDDALVRKALDHVHHTSEPLLTLKNIASAMRVRAGYLTHAFKQRTGQPLYRYIMTLKLSRALHRIATADEDLTQIALDLGFSSHSHFSALFKARYGLSPSQVRHGASTTRARAARASSVADAENGRVAMNVIWRPLCAARGGNADTDR